MKINDLERQLNELRETHKQNQVKTYSDAVNAQQITTAKPSQTQYINHDQQQKTISPAPRHKGRQRTPTGKIEMLKTTTKSTTKPIQTKYQK